jgi:pimeloyl-ACP methyl ester carboxylesterase
MGYKTEESRVFALLVLLALRTHAQGDSEDPDVHHNVSLLITTKGYPCKEYSVTTEDGFILGMQRIPFGRQKSFLGVREPRSVVFLQHGLLDSSSTWVINSDSQSLGFLLADAGFDVWLGNVRGNTYSKAHKNLSPSDSQFWAWSFDEMAEYDLPAMIQYVLNVTGQESIFYVGHSQGAMIALAKLSQDQGLANKIKSFFALAPVATIGNIKGALPLLADLLPELQLLLRLLGVHEFLPSSALMEYLTSHLCHGSVSRYIVGFQCTLHTRRLEHLFRTLFTLRRWLSQNSFRCLTLVAKRRTFYIIISPPLRSTTCLR